MNLNEAMQWGQLLFLMTHGLVGDVATLWYSLIVSNFGWQLVTVHFKHGRISTNMGWKLRFARFGAPGWKTTITPFVNDLSQEIYGVPCLRFGSSRCLIMLVIVERSGSYIF